jgi:hypothetical protein
MLCVLMDLPGRFSTHPRRDYANPEFAKRGAGYAGACHSSASLHREHGTQPVNAVEAGRPVVQA